jgi:hypothetical protein
VCRQASSKQIVCRELKKVENHWDRGTYVRWVG